MPKALKRVAVGDEHLVVERDGSPVVVMLLNQEYENLISKHSLEPHHELVKDLGREAEAKGLTEERLTVDLDKTKEEVYQDRKRH